jgi:hypothetical protein
MTKPYESQRVLKIDAGNIRLKRHTSGVGHTNTGQNSENLLRVSAKGAPVCSDPAHHAIDIIGKGITTPMTDAH